jgi:hypothetical protein
MAAGAAGRHRYAGGAAVAGSQRQDPLVREYIQARFPRVKFVGYEAFGNFHGARERDVVATLPEKLRAHKADAAIVGIGA